MNSFNSSEIMRELAYQLRNGNHALIIWKDDNFSAYNERGLKALLRLWTTSPNILKGSIIADKAVGKAAAAIMAAGGAKAVYTPLISKPGLKMLQDNGVNIVYDTAVDNILNASRTGLCPMEVATQAATTPQDAIARIREAISNMQQHLH